MDLFAELNIPVHEYGISVGWFVSYGVSNSQIKELCMPLGTSCPLSLITYTLNCGEVRFSLQCTLLVPLGRTTLLWLICSSLGERGAVEGGASSYFVLHLCL